MTSENLRVVKRNGTEVDFDQRKIEVAIGKANSQVDEFDRIDDEKIVEIATGIMNKCKDRMLPASVENIQDMVELALMENGAYNLAKHYITYRYKRSQVREYSDSLIDSLKEVISTDSIDSDRKRENGNIDGDTAMGTMLQIGSTSSKYYGSLFLLRPEHNKLYSEGWIHIHK